MAVEVHAGESGLESRFPSREKAAFSYETASGPTNFLNRDPINEPGSQLVRDVKKQGDIGEELNLYAFAGNDPVNRIDLLGLYQWDDSCCVIPEETRREIDEWLAGANDIISRRMLEHVHPVDEMRKEFPNELTFGMASKLRRSLQRTGADGKSPLIVCAGSLNVLRLFTPGYAEPYSGKVVIDWRGNKDSSAEFFATLIIHEMVHERGKIGHDDPDDPRRWAQVGLFGF